MFSLNLTLYAAMPFGYVPVLEVDGRKLSSSGGIARFLAERFGKTLPIVVMLKVGSFFSEVLSPC